MALLHLPALLLGLAAPLRSRHAQPRAALSANAASWSAVEAATSRADMVSSLDALREAGEAKLWGQFKVAPRSVSLRELCQTTRLDEKVLDPTASEFSTKDIQDTFIKVLVGCTFAALIWAVGSDALGLDAGFRFTGTYLIAGIPLAVVAIGSSAPGILFLPFEAFRTATANEEMKRLQAERICKHEASHLLCAYVLGVPVQEVAVGDKGPRVVVYDEQAVLQPGVLATESQTNRLAVIALSGLMAEADAFGNAFGATDDLKLLNQIMLRCKPPIPAQKQQDLTRYSALMAWTIIKKYERAYEAIYQALAQGKGVADCLAAAEAAEMAEKPVMADDNVQAPRKETPQERAAREREEMAARGKRL